MRCSPFAWKHSTVTKDCEDLEEKTRFVSSFSFSSGNISNASFLFIYLTGPIRTDKKFLRVYIFSPSLFLLNSSHRSRASNYKSSGLTSFLFSSIICTLPFLNGVRGQIAGSFPCVEQGSLSAYRASSHKMDPRAKEWWGLSLEKGSLETNPPSKNQKTSRLSCSLVASLVDKENQHWQNDLETAADSHS